MAEIKRYYWLRLHDDFFDSKRIKKLRKMAGGDTYTIIYLKMQLLAMKTEGIIKWTGLEENIAEELALDLDEEVDDVKVTLTYLLHCGLAETSDNINFFFPYAISNTGSETSAAQRMRDSRAKKAIECNNVQNCYNFVTESNSNSKIQKIDIESRGRGREECDCDSDTVEKPVENSKLTVLGGTLGRGLVHLTKDQMENLIDLMGVEMFDIYITKIADFIEQKGAKIHNHYQTILKWYKEDSGSEAHD